MVKYKIKYYHLSLWQRKTVVINNIMTKCSQFVQQGSDVFKDAVYHVEQIVPHKLKGFLISSLCSSNSEF